MKRSKHSLSNTKLLSCNMGQLIPMGVREVLPGDTFQHSTSILCRVAPLQTPVMHPVEMKIHHWFVPSRIIWDDWENFITGGPDGMNASQYPVINTPASTGFAVGSLADYLGVTPGVASKAVSALPFRAYAKIFNEFYRDQDLVAPLNISTASGTDTTTSVALQNVAWEKDYFTVLRTSTQKGPEVSLPLGTTAPVITNGEEMRWTTTGQPSTQRSLSPASGNVSYSGGTATGNFRFGSESGLVADLSEASAATVNQLRLAMALQRYEEARSRYGSRYTEYLAYLGVKSSDARLQRPEYLGGGKQMVQFSEVLQTTPSEEGDGVGSLYGHGIGAMRSNRYRKFFEEHGFVISLVSVRPKTIYMQGVERHWLRRTKEDFWQKELEHIGQQEVWKAEANFATTSVDPVLGYGDRYDEYRRAESTVAGEFRTTLKDWHMARELPNDFSLNADFVTMTPTDRIYQSTTTDQLYLYCKHSIQARRLISKTGHSFIF